MGWLIRFVSSLPQELLLVLLGSLVLFVLQRIWKWVRFRRSTNLLRKVIAAEHDFGCTDIENGVPSISLEDVRLKSASNLDGFPALFFNPHDWGITGFDDSQFDRPSSFLAYQDLSSMCEATGITGLERRVEEAIRVVADQLKEKSHGVRFNNKKYGIYDIFTDRLGIDEHQGLQITLYDTDYFTHRVMKYVYRRMATDGCADFQTLQGVQRGDIFGPRAQHDYRCLLTSLGVNALVICRRLGGAREEVMAFGLSDTMYRAIVFSRRSHEVAVGPNQEKSGVSPLHVTMNEGLSATDYEPINGAASLAGCLKRGLSEELGITDKILSQATKAAFLDVMLVRESFEIGITAVVEFPTPWEEWSRNPARDRNMETMGFEVVALNRKEVARIMQLNSLEITGACKYALSRLAARENIDWESAIH